ncbi:MAG: hypothetical protein ACYC4S_08975 [Rhodoferax sp.]
MARTTKKPQAAPAGDVGIHAPTFTFEPFKWVPDGFDLPSRATVHQRELANLVNHVKDVAGGAETVLQLMLAHGCEIAQGDPVYLKPCHIGMLQQLAIRALQSLDAEADDITGRLRDHAKGKP